MWQAASRWSSLDLIRRRLLSEVPLLSGFGIFLSCKNNFIRNGYGVCTKGWVYAASLLFSSSVCACVIANVSSHCFEWVVELIYKESHILVSQKVCLSDTSQLSIETRAMYLIENFGQFITQGKHVVKWTKHGAWTPGCIYGTFLSRLPLPKSRFSAYYFYMIVMSLGKLCWLACSFLGVLLLDMRSTHYVEVQSLCQWVR